MRPAAPLRTNTAYRRVSIHLRLPAADAGNASINAPFTCDGTAYGSTPALRPDMMARMTMAWRALGVTATLAISTVSLSAQADSLGALRGTARAADQSPV